MVNPPLRQVADVRFAVPGREILAPLSLSLAPGRVHRRIGPGGAGKSMLLNALLKRHLRQVSPANRTITCEGRPLPPGHEPLGSVP